MDLDAGMDLLQGVQEADGPAGAGVPPGAGDFEMPSLEKLMEMLEHLDMSEEDKNEMKKTLLQRGDLLGNIAGLGKESAAPGGLFDPSTQFLIFFVAVALITFVFVHRMLRELDAKMDAIRTKENAERLIKAKVDELAEKLAGFQDKMESMKDNLVKEFASSSSSERAKLMAQIKNTFNESGDYVMYTYLKFIAAFLVILVVFVFFGYKLYKSLVEKEKKREDKKKLKMQKKKK